MKKVIIKIIILGIIVFIYNVIMQFISPTITNSLALNQMQNSIDSSFGIQLYTYVSNYSWIVLVIIVIAMFYKDVIKIIKKIKESKKNENKNY